MLLKLPASNFYATTRHILLNLRGSSPDQHIHLIPMITNSASFGYAVCFLCGITQLSGTMIKQIFRITLRSWSNHLIRKNPGSDKCPLSQKQRFFVRILVHVNCNENIYSLFFNHYYSKLFYVYKMALS